MSVYELAVRLTLSTDLMRSGAEQAMGLFGKLEAAAARTEAQYKRSAEAMIAASARLATANKNMFSSIGTPNYQSALNAYNAASTAEALALNRVTLAANEQKAAMLTLAAAKKSAMILGVGAGLTVAGVIGMDIVKHWSENAMGFQLIQTLIQQTTQASVKDMELLNRAIDASTGKFQMSKTQLAQLSLDMSQMGISGDPKRGITAAQQIAEMLPQVAAFAEMRHVGSGENVNEAAKSAVAAAHLFGQYNQKGDIGGPGMEKLIAYFQGALQITHGTSTALLANVSQMAGGSRSLYGTVNDPKQMDQFIRDMLGAAVMETQLGQQGRGATQLLNAMIKTLPSAAGQHNANLHNPALQALERASVAEGGAASFQKDGHIAPLMQVLSVISHAEVYASKHKQNIELGKDIQLALGLVGAKNIPLLADPKTMDQLLRNMAHVMNTTPGLMLQNRDQLNQTGQGQMNQFHANMSTISTNFGNALIPELETIGRLLANITDGIVRFQNQHARLTRFIATFAAIASVVALIVGPILMVVGAVGIMVIAFGAATGASIALGTAVTFALWPIGLIIAGITAITLLIMNWDSVTKGIRDHLGALGPVIFGIGAAIGVIGAALGIVALGPIALIVAAIGVVVTAIVLIVNAVTHWHDIMRVIVSVFNAVKDAGAAAWKAIGDAAMTALNWVVDKIKWIKDAIDFFTGNGSKKKAPTTTPPGSTVPLGTPTPSGTPARPPLGTGTTKPPVTPTPMPTLGTHTSATPSPSKPVATTVSPSVSGPKLVKGPNGQIIGVDAQGDRAIWNGSSWIPIASPGHGSGRNTATPHLTVTTQGHGSPPPVTIVNNNHFHQPIDPGAASTHISKKTADALKRHLANPVAKPLSVHPTAASPR